MNSKQQGIYLESHEHVADQLFPPASGHAPEREAQLPPPQQLSPRRRSNETTKKKGNFPFILMHMLQTIEVEEPYLARIVSWTPDGTTFQIHDKTRFENEIQQRFFKQSSYSSFRRQLNIWGFKAVGDRKTKKTTALYRHPMFLRDNPKLCYAMARKGAKGSLSDLYPQMKCDNSASRSSSIDTGFLRRSSTQSESNSVPSAKSSSQHEMSEPYQSYDKISLQKGRTIKLFQDPVAKSEEKGPDLYTSQNEINFPSTSYHQQHEAQLKDASDVIHRSSLSYPLLPQNIQRQTSIPDTRQISSSFQLSDHHFSQEEVVDPVSSKTSQEPTRPQSQSMASSLPSTSSTTNANIENILSQIKEIDRQTVQLSQHQEEVDPVSSRSSQEPTREGIEQSLESLRPQSQSMASSLPSTSSTTNTNIENILSQIKDIDRQTKQLDQQFDPSKLYLRKRRPSLFSSFSYPLLQDNSIAQYPSFRSVQESSSSSSPYSEGQDDTTADRGTATLPTVLLDEVEPIYDEEAIKPLSSRKRRPSLFSSFSHPLLQDNPIAQYPSFRSVKESPSESSPYSEGQDDLDDNRGTATLPTVLLDEVEPIYDEEEMKPIPPFFETIFQHSNHDAFRRESPKEEE